MSITRERLQVNLRTNFGGGECDVKTLTERNDARGPRTHTTLCPRRVRAHLILIAAVLSACVAQPKEPPRAAASIDEWLLSYAGAFRRAEPVLLGMLARTDARIAGRFSRRTGVRGRFTDPFLFDMRRRGHEDVLGEAQRCAIPKDLLPNAGPLTEHRIEQELLLRLIDEEEARLDQERRLPASAADLLRALAVSWPSLESATERGTTESLVAWRLDQVRGALAPNALSAMERDDLMDALDDLAQAIERAPAPRAESAARRLHEELAVLRVAPFDLRGWEDVARPLRVHVGVVSGEAKLRSAFAGARGRLAAQLDVAFAVLGPEGAEEVRRMAGVKVARAPECPVIASMSSMRALAPPPERAWVCAAVFGAREAESELAELVSLIVLHDLVTAGAWAVDLHGDQRDPATVRARSPLIARIEPAAEALVLREAATHPVGPIGGAATVVLLLANGPAHVRDRADAWASFGDAPLDVIGRELFTDNAAR